jgi:PAS domain S-box-containing protein
MMNEQTLLNSAMTRWANDLAAQGILTTDAELKIRGWNHWLEFHTGHGAGEMIGRELFEAFPELVARRLDRYFRDALEGQVGILSQRLHGHLLSMPSLLEGTALTNMRQSARIAPLLIDGQVIGTITVIDDVTERVVREAELQDQIAALEALHDIGRAILSLDLADCLRRVVSLTSAVTGAEMAAVVLREGEHLKMAACAGREIAPSELRIAAQGNIASRVAQSGRALSVMDQNASTAATTLHPNHQCAAAAPLVSERGVIGALVIESHRPGAFSQTDMAQLSRLATQSAIAIENARLYGSLRDSEQLLSTTLKSIHDAVIAADSKGELTFINPVAQSLTGWEQEQAAGRTLVAVFDIVDEETRQRDESGTMRALFEGVAHRFGDHSALVAKDGTIRPIDGGSSPIKDSEGRVIGVVLVFRDITERRQIERAREELFKREKFARAQAEEANRLKDEFLATLSHELRNPLNIIVGYSEVLARSSEAKQSELICHAAETIQRNAGVQSQLINDLLDLSRLQTGKLALEPRPLSLAAVIGDAVESIREQAAGKEIMLSVDLPPQQIVVSADQVRVQQIVWNLVTNAVKFTPKGGRISVTLEEDGGEAALTVEDNGQGIDQEFLPHVFEMFRQADASATRKHGGMGIGLALVRQLADLHGGRVEAHSEGVGRGARFVVRLPLHTDSITTHTAATKRVAEGELTGARILVVDDTNDSLDLLRILLTNKGAIIETALNGEEGLRAAESSDFDLILSDISMPGMDGYAFLRALREKPRHATTPAIALTGFGRPEDVEKARQAGFTTHLTKPLDFGTLVKLARVTLRK